MPIDPMQTSRTSEDSASALRTPLNASMLKIIVAAEGRSEQTETVASELGELRCGIAELAQRVSAIGEQLSPTRSPETTDLAQRFREIGDAIGALRSDLATVREDRELIRNLESELSEARKDLQNRDVLGPAIQVLINVVDYLERPLRAWMRREQHSFLSGEEQEAISACQTALRRILSFLEVYEVRPLRTRKGEKFDSAKHRVARTVPAPDRSAIGSIIEVGHDGYIDASGRSVRHAQVVVYGNHQ